ncbi:MAG: winged helix-turn-helix domain-containing protein [Saprospiraceae bacterium]|nr:winged helix-turn-helix domain-containing protein [Saprospiraceae bacterium]
MIETLISSKTRIKLLMKFFLNSNTVSYLRGLESEFGESTNAIRVELNRLEEANMLSSYTEGNKKYFKANKAHPLFGEIHNILRKHIGIDQIIENVVDRLGDIQSVYLAGDFAKGKDSPIIDLLLVGDIDTAYLIQLIEKTEKLINRKIRYLIYTRAEANGGVIQKHTPEPLLLWTKN